MFEFEREFVVVAKARRRRVEDFTETNINVLKITLTIVGNMITMIKV